jgi:hypothetical protein
LVKPFRRWLLEVLFVLTFTLGLGAVAVFMALHEKPVPVASMLRLPVHPGPVLIAAAPSAFDLEEPALPRKAQTQPESNFSQTDVLLADTLTEMISLKAEIYHLRNRVETLSAEVARLAGDPPGPKPPAHLRKAPRKAA